MRRRSKLIGKFLDEKGYNLLDITHLKNHTPRRALFVRHCSQECPFLGVHLGTSDRAQLVFPSRQADLELGSSKLKPKTR